MVIYLLAVNELIEVIVYLCNGIKKCTKSGVDRVESYDACNILPFVTFSRSNSTEKYITAEKSE